MNFGNMTTAPTAALAGVVTAPMTMEGLLGINANDARILEGMAIWPAGRYQLQLTGLDASDYEIRQEDHPFVGQKALKVELKFQCLATSGALKDKNGKLLSAEAAQEWIGQEFIEGVLFGNDGLPSKKNPNEVAHPGRDKLFTILANIAGPQQWEALKAATGGDLQKIVSAMLNKPFGCEIGHNINPNDPNKRVQHQLSVFGDWAPAALG